ncbi:hypothetical protein [Vibrio harveyi]|uniref:hypothetical protein n=1 Tax=Vibrio harveyi TaxID=669 RepID=UPI003CF5B4B8
MKPEENRNMELTAFVHEGELLPAYRELKDFPAIAEICDDNGIVMEILYLLPPSDIPQRELRRDLRIDLEFTLKNNVIKSASQIVDGNYASLGTIRTRKGPETMFSLMQGENWSPQGEARDFIQGKGLQHTSMSVGDIIKAGGKHYFVDMVGFSCIEDVLAKDQDLLLGR